MQPDMKVEIKIEHTIDPSLADIDILTQGILKETPDYGSAHIFAFFIRDESDSIIAGCNGSVFFGCIYTDQLWVHKNHRMAGYGKQLMDSVHKYGQEQGCSIATLGTMNFQNALSFYKKLGYTEDFKQDGYALRSSCLFLKKML